MRTILVCAGVYGNENALQKLLEVARRRKPDWIFFAGGITAPDAEPVEKARFMGRFFQTLGESGSYAAVIPGPNDAPLREFLRAALNSEVVYPGVFSAHATPVTNRDVVVGGLGGLLTETEDVDAPVIKYSHASAEYFLRGLWRIERPIKVLMLSESCPGTAEEGGNPIVKEFIKSYHPHFAIAGDKMQCRGTRQVTGNSREINPGSLSEGSAAWVERLTGDIEMLDL